MYIADFACVTALGISAETTFAAIDAQVSGYQESHYKCENGQPATMALLDEGLMYALDISTEYTGGVSEQMIRCAKLAFFALSDLTHRVTLPAPAPLIWLGDEQQNPENAAHPENLPQDFIATVLNEFDAPIDAQNTFYINQGRVSGIGALKLAHQLLHEQGHNYVILGSASSTFDDNALDWLDKKQRLKNEAAKDAFVPGEASAFLVLAKTPQLTQAINPNMPAITCSLPGIARSPSHWFNTVPHTGEALSQAIAQVLDTQPNPTTQIQSIISSLNGELFWMKEHGIAMMRAADQCQHAALYHHAEYIGDVGAACGLLNIGHAMHLLKNKQHQNALVYASADGPWRAACLLNSVNGKKHG